MTRENYFSDHEENLTPSLLTFEDVEQNLYSSKHHIQQLKKSLHTFSMEKIDFIQRIMELDDSILDVKEEERKDSNLPILISAKKEPLAEVDQLLIDIRNLMKKYRGTEGKLRQDLKKKDATLRNVSFQKDHLLQEITEYQNMLGILEQQTNSLSRSLNKSEHNKKNLLILADKEKHILINQFEERESQLKKTILFHQKNEDSLNEIVAEKERAIHTFQQEVIELQESIGVKDSLIRQFERENPENVNNWVETEGKLPKQNQGELNTLKRGSWIQMVWNLWGRDDTHYLEKIEELNNTIKELQQGLSQNENMFDKMNSYFERYEQNELKYSEQLRELNDQVQSFKDNENVYLGKLKDLKNELTAYKEQNQAYQEKVEAMGQTIKEMEQKEEEYQSKMDQMKIKEMEQSQQLKKTIRNFQDKEKQYAERFQQALGQPQGRLENQRQSSSQFNSRVQRQSGNQVNSKGQNRATQQTRQTEQQKLNQLDMIQKFYPQSRSQTSIFNPFKYSK
jgi:chromosome segregation ATPase